MLLKKIVLGVSITTMIAASAVAFAAETKAPANLAAPTASQTTCPGKNGQGMMNVQAMMSPDAMKQMMNGQAMMSPEAMKQMMNGQTCPGATNQAAPAKQAKN